MDGVTKRAVIFAESFKIQKNYFILVKLMVLQKYPMNGIFSLIQKRLKRHGKLSKFLNINLIVYL